MSADGNVLDPAIFDLDILAAILDYLKPFGRPDPRYAHLGSNTVSPEWE